MDMCCKCMPYPLLGRTTFTMEGHTGIGTFRPESRKGDVIGRVLIAQLSTYACS